MKQSLIKVSLYTLIIILLFSTLTGCYNSKELDDLAYVIGIAIDKGEEKEFMFTLQIAVPVKIASEGSEPRQRLFYFDNHRSRFTKHSNILR